MENLTHQNVYSVPFFWLLPDLNDSCPICGASEQFFASPYPTEDKYFKNCIVLFCKHCGSGLVPNAERLIGEYYHQNYAEINRKDRNIEPSIYFSAESRKKYKKLGRYFSRSSAKISALKKYNANFDCVLDYGSGPGYFLYLSQPKNSFAVELDQQSDKYLDFLEAKKMHPDQLPENFFDVIVASHSIEHFTPEELHNRLIQMANALKRSGILLIEVPQGGHSYLVLTTRQDPHTIFFTPQGIYDAVSRTGLNILSAYARGKSPVKLHPHGIYKPPEGNDFFQTRAGGLTIICQKNSA